MRRRPPHPAYLAELDDEHRDILKAEALEVTKATGVPLCEMEGSSRIPAVYRARHALMARLRARWWSLAEIGQRLGGRHHSTVLYGLRSHELRQRPMERRLQA